MITRQTRRELDAKRAFVSWLETQRHRDDQVGEVARRRHAHRGDRGILLQWRLLGDRARSRASCKQRLGDTQRRARRGVRSVTQPAAESCSDLGNGRRLAHRFSARIRFVHTHAKWMHFDGRSWRIDDSGEIDRLAKATALSILEEAMAADQHERLRLLKWAAASESYRKRRDMIASAQSEPGIPAAVDAFDVDPYLLCVRNGTLDLRSARLRPHDPADMISKVAGVHFEADAKAPTWAAFLRRALDNDQDNIRFLQRAVGYTLTGDTSEQCLFFLHGTGANGKTRFLEVLLALLGQDQYARTASFSAFLERRDGSIPNDIAALVGARLVVASEANAGQRFNESLIKSITGNDPVSARFMRGEFFTFRPRPQALARREPQAGYSRHR